MERREQDSNFEAGTSAAEEKIKSMIDITFRMKGNDMFGKNFTSSLCAAHFTLTFLKIADLKVFSFNLILSMDFLMKLSSFLQPAAGNASPNAAEIALEAKEVESRRRKSSISGVQAQQDAEKTITLALHIQDNDVILVEKMDDINCLALILNVIKIFDFFL